MKVLSMIVAAMFAVASANVFAAAHAGAKGEKMEKAGEKMEKKGEKMEKKGEKAEKKAEKMEKKAEDKKGGDKK